MNIQFLTHFSRCMFFLIVFFQTFPSMAGDYWDDNAYLCQAQDGLPFNAPPFPAKKGDGQCDDGDATLFNGLLCASGDQRGCDAVKNSQTANGKFWRSPRRAETNNLGKGDSVTKELSFSPDQDLGALLYVIATGDTGALQRWLDWLEKNRPCAIGNPFAGGKCQGDSHFYLKGLPRYCAHQNCTLRPLDRDMLNEVAQFYHLNIPSGIAHYYSTASSLSLGFIDILLGQYGADYLGKSTSSKISLHSFVENSGFPLHLNGVRTLILRKIGNKDAELDLAVSHLIDREGNNPFFQYLQQGATQEVANSVMQYCPSYSQPLYDLNNLNQYIWEQANSSQWSKPFKKDGKINSMLWDCIMMRNLSPSLYPKQVDPAVLSAINSLLLDDEPCTVTVTPTRKTVTYKGGDFTADVTAPSSCHWTASADSPWLTLTSGATGVGNGTVQYQVPANTTFKQTSYSIAVTGDNTATLNIKQKANPGVDVGNISALEGAVGTTKTVTFKLILNVKPSKAITVSYATQDGKAKAGSDYVATSGSVTFNKGETAKTVNVSIQGDDVVEANETFKLVLSNPTAPYQLIKTFGVATIKNDD